MLVWGDRKSMVMFHPLRVTQKYYLASMAAWLSFTGIFPPWSPPSHPLNPSFCTQHQPSPWDCSIIPKVQLPAAAPSRGPVFLSGVCMAAARTVWFSFHLGCHRSAVSLSALNVSPLTQTTAPVWGSDQYFSFPHSLRTRPVLLTLLFPPLVPSFYQILPGSVCSFPLVRYSCLLSAGVLRARLCLKVYSWWIHGERCTPRPPTPLPSCSPLSHLWSPKPLPWTTFLVYIWKWCLRGKF